MPIGGFVKRREAEEFTRDLEKSKNSVLTELDYFLRYYDILLSKLDSLEESSILDIESELNNRYKRQLTNSINELKDILRRLGVKFESLKDELEENIYNY